MRLVNGRRCTSPSAYVLIRTCSSGEKRNTAASSLHLLDTLELFDFKGRGKACISCACLLKSKILHSESIQAVTYSDTARLALPQLHRDPTDMPWEPLPPPSSVPLKLPRSQNCSPLFPRRLYSYFIFVVFLCLRQASCRSILTLWYANSGSPELGGVGVCVWGRWGVGQKPPPSLIAPSLWGLVSPSRRAELSPQPSRGEHQR